MSFTKKKHHQVFNRPLKWGRLLAPLILSICFYFFFLSYDYGETREVRHSATQDVFLRVSPKLQLYQLKPNSRTEIIEVPLTYLHMKYPDAPKYAFVTLVTNNTEDVEQLCTAITSLLFIQNDVQNFPAPILVFNEGNLNKFQLQQIVRTTRRAVAFPLVDFDSFPPGFNPEQHTPEFVVSNRSEWGYYQMIRFWITGIWKHLALDPFDIVIRLDSDSCFKEPNTHLPQFEYDHISYHSQYVGMVSNPKYVEQLYDFAQQYIKKHNVIPTNTLLWQMVKSSWEDHSTLPLFMSNFEICRKSFMQHPDVMKWHEALTEQEPYGVFRYRWSDSVVRFLTAAMFIQNENVMTSQPRGYHHREGCERDQVEMALKSYQISM